MYKLQVIVFIRSFVSFSTEFSLDFSMREGRRSLMVFLKMNCLM